MNRGIHWLAALVIGVGLCQAQQPTDAQIAEIKKLMAGLHYQEGSISLNKGMARIALTPEFRFLDSKDAETVLVKLWNNPPPQESVLGMLVPARKSVLSDDAWAVIITYTADGYVKDDEAASINYDDLLKQMKDATKEANPERIKNGYKTIDLVGWAAPPRYDKQTHKMYWAKEIKFGDATENTLNYNIRMLGRRGVLVLNAVADMKQLPAIQTSAPALLSMVDFCEGHRYVDFDSKTDAVATYGLAALVAGGVAAKMGFFKVIWVALLAAKKFVLLAIVAIGGWLSKLFGKKKSSASQDAA